MRSLPEYKRFHGETFELIEDRLRDRPALAHYRRLGGEFYAKFRVVADPYGFWAVYGLPKEEQDA